MSYTASYIVNSSSAQGTTDFQFTFPYIKEEHIEVFLNYNKITQGSGSAQYQVITNVSPKLIRLNTGIASANLRVEVRRNSSLGSPLVDYADGSTLTANDLDTSALQSLYIDQELRDNQGKTVSVDEATGLPTLNNLRLTNVGDPTAAQDAATKNYVDTTAEPKSAKLTELATMAQNTANALADLTATEVQAIDGLTASTDELNILDGVTATKDEINILDGVTATKDELNILDGVTATKDEINILDGVTATKDELNILDGVTATKDELNILDGVTATKDEINILDGVTATKDELNILDGVTATKDEINILDGVTATKDEINKLDGVTASTAEINKLDGVTATTTELNKLDGVTASTDELNKTDGLLATPTELNTLDGITSNTSELNKLDGVTASTAELNIVAGKSFKTSSGTLDTTSDTEIPSSKVIAAHVASSQTAIGGFVTIANEVSFPTTANMPANGVVVSINNAAGVVVNGSGVSTTGRTTDGTPATVTINGFPSSLNGETLAAGVGLMVTATSTSNTYSYHKILAAETDVKQLSDDINDFNARYRVAGSAPGSSNDAGDLYFDTSANKMKVYNGTTNAWDDVASVGNFYINTISSSSGTGGGNATFNGSAYRFTLSNPPTMAQQLIVSVNGVIQKPNSGTSQPSEGFAISGNDIIFSAAPASGSDYFIVTQGSSVSIGTPSDNTITNAKIVDGEITNAKISSSANIAGSKVADDSITEVKLDIHNAPATDKYLKYTSNGMEWSDGASEGTDVKSTGESGTTKFLRVDGDGTCSWQVPPDTNTQLTLHDEDNFASNSATAAASQQSIKAYVDTQVGSISAAPEITATASGTIAADKSVYVKSDGTVAQVVQNPAGFTSSEYTFEADSMGADIKINHKAIAYDVTNKVMVCVYKDSANNNYLTGVAGTMDAAGAITWGTPVAHTSGNAITEVSICWDSWSGKFVVAYRDASGTRGQMLTATTSGTTLTWGGNLNNINGNGDMSWITIAAFPNAQRCMVVYRDHADNYKLKSRVIHSHDNNNPQGHSPTEMQTDNCVGMRLIFDPDANRAVLAYASATGSYKGYIQVATVGSSSASWNSRQEFTDNYILTGDGDAQGGIDLVYSEGVDKALVVYLVADGDSDRIIGRRAFSVGSSSVTFTCNDGYIDDTSDFDGICLSANPTNGEILITYSDWEDDKKGKGRMLTLNSGGTTVTVGSETTFNSSVTSSKSTQNLAAVFHKDQDSHIVVYTDNGDSNKGKAIAYIQTSTDMTTENFIGFSSAGYSNGNTATIKVVGNTSTQSSLTPGQKYYVQQDGTLGLTPAAPNVEAGIALSSTKLLIKG